MPKHSRESLKKMAEGSMQAKESGDPRYGMMMAINTGLSQDAI